MHKPLTALTMMAAMGLATAPVLAQETRTTTVDAPRAPAEPLGLLDGNAEVSSWIGATDRTGNGTIRVWVWLFTPSPVVEGAIQGVAFHDEIDCATGRFRQIGHEIYRNGTFERGYAVSQDFREPAPQLREATLIPYVCSGRTPEIRVANPAEAQRYFRR